MPRTDKEVSRKQMSNCPDTFDERWNNVRFYASPEGVRNPGSCNLATINGVPDQPYEACSLADPEDWSTKGKKMWAERADRYYREEMNLVFIGVGEITKIRQQFAQFGVC